MKRGLKTALIWGLLVGVVILVLISRQEPVPEGSVSPTHAVTMIERGDVNEYRFDGKELSLQTSGGQLVTVEPGGNASVWQSLRSSGVQRARTGNHSDYSGLVGLLVIIAVVAALVYFLRKMRGGSVNNIFELRRSKARPVENADKAHFADIGGNRQAVELLGDIVDFLRAPERWTAAGLRIPRGVLVVGPPGTGKTLLARAVAGETQAALFYTSAAEFVELFVGVGAARVRDTFQKAAAQQPAVIFIDELDAVGRRRGSGSGAMHEEREQTLNQLLVLMDGMEQHKRLVVIAATNRPDILDPAQLRSGRFDRMLRLKLPTAAERIEILRIHTRNKPLDPQVSIERIADQTENFSGADLEALANAAGLLAVRRTREGASHNGQAAILSSEDFQHAIAEMTSSNRVFDRLDSVMVESVSQFAEPVGRAVARVTLTTGAVIEGEVQWMNATHIKLRLADETETIVAKELAAQIVPLKGTESAPQSEFTPDRWAERDLDVG
jgi:ATP-dependent Zn protease